MELYKITQIVEVPSQREAVLLATEIVANPIQLGFPYQYKNQVIQPTFPNMDTSVLDKIVKQVIAAAVIYYISKSMKKWARE